MLSDNHHSKSLEEIYSELRTSEQGLTQEDAKQRLEQYGKNEIKKTNRLRPLKILIEQFNSFLIYILIVAAIISFFINHNLDAIVITVVIIINAAIGFTQQYKTEKALENLKKLIISKSRVLRNGRLVEIPSSELVVGDIILFEQGEKINADCRIIESENAQTNEAILTGESTPVTKTSKQISQKAELSKRENMLFTGTQIVRGSAKAIVVQTGMNTIFGKIAESLQEIDIQKTPMQKRLDKFSKQIGLIILAMVGFVMLLGIFEKFPASDMFLTSVALAVSAIPAGLPAVLTISFAIASMIMAESNVVIRRLPAVESLGSVTVICSDKTGTITEEKMKVQRMFFDDKFYTKNENEILFEGKKIDYKNNRDLFYLLKTSVLCNNARFELVDNEYEFIGDPTEIALVSSSLNLGINKKELIESEPSLAKIEFSSKRKMMSVIRDNKRNNIMYSKGAIENILDASNFELVEGRIKNLNAERKIEILEKSKDMEKDALRVLAFAYRNFSKNQTPEERGLIFLGLIGMLDSPRKEVKEAITQARNAGIEIKMITGDSAITAVAVAKQIGINGKIMIGSDLEKISDEDLSKIIHTISIFARTTPHQKLRITKVLQSLGEVVAITGDGINDALALKSADIGVAMGKKGTDVSRDVSDIVLMDDNFASIIKGVEQGRKTYDNIKKFTKYFLAVNFSEIFLILITLTLGVSFGTEKWFLPLLPLQLLWINLITDSFPALALAMEKPEDVMNTKPRGEKSILDGIWKFVMIGGFLALITELIAYFIGIGYSFTPAKTQSLVLTTAIFFEIFFVYTCRSEKSVFKIGIFSNKWLNYAVIFSIGLHLILLYTPLSIAFGVTALGISDWLIVLPLAISGLILFEIGKLIKERIGR